MKKKLLKKTKKAFTLIEMVIVLFIISLLLLIILPNLGEQKKSASNKTDEAFRTTLQTQVDLYDGNAKSFDDLENAHLISNKQMKKATDEGYTIINGNVEKK
ncbi:competence type IV pilus major pilin ComGC [Companilactobacillus metriopterae]|uniref:competence type IV pilus major pilin ComGC n=1 Tax=Companilactobacillus metriopterae TaxID=1909267 RepID=UPI00100C0F58|nr:competence type IV pilus major pilin ComGC [Companilactobacillus metriopterae]